MGVHKLISIDGFNILGLCRTNGTVISHAEAEMIAECMRSTFNKAKDGQLVFSDEPHDCANEQGKSKENTRDSKNPTSIYTRFTRMIDVFRR